VRTTVELRLKAADIAAHIGQRGRLGIVEMWARQPNHLSFGMMMKLN